MKVMEMTRMKGRVDVDYDHDHGSDFHGGKKEKASSSLVVMMRQVTHY